MTYTRLSDRHWPALGLWCVTLDLADGSRVRAYADGLYTATRRALAQLERT